MGFLDKAKSAAEEAAHRANETIADVQSKRELSKAYQELGQTAFKLTDSGAVSHPELAQQVARIREMEAKLNERKSAAAANSDAPAAQPTEAVEQPLSGAGPGAS
jgi:hypothetical protein